MHSAGETPDHTPNSPLVRRWSLLAAGVILALAGGHWCIYTGYTIDDAFISFRYAENFSAGKGLVFNPGERVEGYTNFLWVMVLSAGSLIGLETLVWAKGLGFVLTLTVVGLTIRLGIHAGRQMGLGGGVVVGLIAGAAMASSGSLMASGADGLETQLLLVLLIAGTLRYLGEQKNRQRLPLSALLFLAVGLTRPDGCLFYVMILLHMFVWRSRSHIASNAERSDVVPEEAWLDQAWWRRGIGPLLFILLGGAYFLWRYNYYGYPLPNTFYAKQVASSELVDRGLERLALFLWRTGLFGLPLAIVGAVRMRWSPLSSLMHLFVLSRLGFAVLSGGAWMGWEYGRFFLPALPFLVIWASCGLVCLGEQVQRLRWGNQGIVTVGLLIAGCAISGYHSMNYTKPTCHSYAQGLEQAHIQLGEHLQEVAPAGARLACGDAGALPYYSGLYTIDMLGLNDEHIAHLEGHFYEKLDPAYILGKEPTYIVVLSSSSKEFVPLTSISGLMYLIAMKNPELGYRMSAIARFHDTYYLWLLEKGTNALNDDANSSHIPDLAFKGVFPTVRYMAPDGAPSWNLF